MWQCPSVGRAVGLSVHKKFSKVKRIKSSVWLHIVLMQIMQIMDIMHIMHYAHYANYAYYANYAICTLCIMLIMHYAHYALCTLCIMHIMHHAHYALCTLCIIFYLAQAIEVFSIYLSPEPYRARNFLSHDMILLFIILPTSWQSLNLLLSYQGLMCIGWTQYSIEQAMFWRILF